MNPLPEKYLESIAELLKEASMASSFDDFLATYAAESQRALRLNTLKIKSLTELRALLERIWALEASESNAEGVSLTKEVPWSSDGFYYDTDISLGRSLANRLGLYYIQEPSAMLPAEALASQSGERVIDLCAAPGGKSAKIAADLDGEGLLVSNDISSSRGRILVRNLEQLGVTNVLVTAADPVDLAKRWPASFDRVLVDAPCSGEGMFRRDPKAIQSWSTYGPDSIIPIQHNILDAAYHLLKAGGELVYSTCTFNRRENEDQIEAVLERFSDLELVDLHRLFPEDSELGLGIQIESARHDMKKAARIWPHLTAGEGHFCARLRKRAAEPSSPAKPKKTYLSRMKSQDRELLSAFYQEMLSTEAWQRMEEAFEERLSLDHGRFHLVADAQFNLKGLHVLKDGIYLANLKEGRKQNHIEAAHSAALCFRSQDIREDRQVNLSLGDRRITQIIKAETIALTEDEYARLHTSIKSPARGHLIVFVEDLPLCWLKLDPGGTVKNLYPAGWRQS